MLPGTCRGTIAAMPQHANDQAQFLAAKLGDTISVSVLNGSSVRSAQLAPGRYLLHFASFSDTAAGLVWVRQGGSTVVAAAAVPSTAFGPAATLRSMEFLVLPGSPSITAGATSLSRATPTDDYLAFWGATGTAVAQITRISSV